MGDALAKSTEVYENRGNPPLIDLLAPGCTDILDIGCGAGDNARLVKARNPGARIVGITRSQKEAAIAGQVMDRCVVADIERGVPDELAGRSFDALIFSHVLEHLVEPWTVLSTYSRLLAPEGVALIAVPNIAHWRSRAQILAGEFRYAEAGIFDVTHLRFFTYLTADRYLLSASPGMILREKRASGDVPLWWARRYILPSSLSKRIDGIGARLFPNLFASQTLLRVEKAADIG